MRLALIVFSAFMSAAAPVWALQQDVAGLYRTALANNPTPIMLRRQLGGWAADRVGRAGESAGQADTYLREELAETIRRDTVVRAARIAPADLGSICVNTGLSDCQTYAAGSMITRDGDAIYYQIQGSFPSMAQVFLIADGAELKPIAWTFGGQEFPTPQIHRTEDGLTYVGVSGYALAAGAYNTNVIFRWDAASRSLIEIDAYSWEDDLSARLPSGLSMSNGVEINWSTLWGKATLFGEDDPGCCATGGVASLGFEIRDYRLVLTEVEVQPDDSARP